jgi:hypothetical protein
VARVYGEVSDGDGRLVLGSFMRGETARLWTVRGCSTTARGSPSWAEVFFVLLALEFGALTAFAAGSVAFCCVAKRGFPYL